jgi:hypothetical protein
MPTREQLEKESRRVRHLPHGAGAPPPPWSGAWASSRVEGAAWQLRPDHARAGAGLNAAPVPCTSAPSERFERRRLFPLLTLKSFQASFQDRRPSLDPIDLPS